MDGMLKEASLDELNQQAKRCWWTTCKKRAWFEDWTGARFCLKHTHYTWKWGGGNKWFGFKNLSIYWPKKTKHLNSQLSTSLSPTIIDK